MCEMGSAASGVLSMLDQSAPGLYRKGSWAFVGDTDGYRLAIPRDQYEHDGHRPAFDVLQSEDEFHEHVLGYCYGDND